MESAVKGGGDIARVAWLKFDAGFIDGLVNGIAWITGQFGRLFRVIQTGFVRGYALMMLVGGVAILGYFAYVLANLGGGK